jgi:ribosomal protein S21
MRRTGIYRRVKEIEFYKRPLSKTKKKEKALRGLKIQKEKEKMRKLGKNLY